MLTSIHSYALLIRSFNRKEIRVELTHGLAAGRGDYRSDDMYETGSVFKRFSRHSR